MADFTKAIELTDKPAPYYSARSCVYNDLNEDKPRLKDMKKAVEYEPDNAEYQFQFGKCKQELGPEEFKTAVDKCEFPDLTDAVGAACAANDRRAWRCCTQTSRRPRPSGSRRLVGPDRQHPCSSDGSASCTPTDLE